MESARLKSVLARHQTGSEVARRGEAGRGSPTGGAVESARLKSVLAWHQTGSEVARPGRGSQGAGRLGGAGGTFRGWTTSVTSVQRWTRPTRLLKATGVFGWWWSVRRLVRRVRLRI